jgi:hypothetical protein
MQLPEKGKRSKFSLWKAAAISVLGLFLFIELFFLIVVFCAQNFAEIRFLASIFPSSIIEETNKQRELYNLLALEPSLVLEKAAQMKANDMAQDGYFAHSSPNGKNPWYWLEQVGYQYSYAGENLAMNFSESQNIVDAWMDSIGHRSNILNKKFRQVGIGISRGIYEGEETTFVVQYFATPANIANVKNKKTSVAKKEQQAKFTDRSPENFTATSSFSKEDFSVIAGAEITPRSSPEVKELSESSRAVSFWENGPNNLKAFWTYILPGVFSGANLLYMPALFILYAIFVIRIFYRGRKQHVFLIFCSIALVGLVALFFLFQQPVLFQNGAIF